MMHPREPNIRPEGSTRFAVGKWLAVCSGISLVLGVLLFLWKMWQPAIGAIIIHWALGLLAMQLSRRTKKARYRNGGSEHNRGARG